MLIRTVSDPQDIGKATHLAHMAVENTFYLRESFVRRSGWAVVAVESASHFNETDAERVSNAAEYSGFLTCYAVATEELKDVPMYYEVRLTKDGLLAFQKEASLFNFVLIPDGGGFVILCTTADYYLVAGEVGFVERVVGMAVSEAWREFCRFSSDMALDPITRNHLRYIVTRYGNSHKA